MHFLKELGVIIIDGQSLKESKEH